MKRMLLAIALGGIVGPVAAQAPIPAALAPGEVLLQIVGDGEDRRPADDIVLTIEVGASGATIAEARSADQAKVEKLVAALTVAGIDRAAVTPLPMGSTRPALIMPMMNTPARPNPPQRPANTTVRVRLTSAAQVARVRDTLEDQDVSFNGTPALALRDSRAARQAAVVDATAHARRDADLEASALGLRIVRMVRVANYGPTGALVDYISNAVSLFDPRRDGGSADVVTRARIAIDYVAVPAK